MKFLRLASSMYIYDLKNFSTELFYLFTNILGGEVITQMVEIHLIYRCLFELFQNIKNYCSLKRAIISENAI